MIEEPSSGSKATEYPSVAPHSISSVVSSDEATIQTPKNRSRQAKKEKNVLEGSIAKGREE